MELKDITSKTPSVTKDMSIRKFVELLIKNKIDIAPVVENDVVVGVVSEKDLTIMDPTENGLKRVKVLFQHFLYIKLILIIKELKS